jgi:ribosomal protein L11 methyltransferase
MDYIELNVNIFPRNPWAEILMTDLAELGFDSFVDTENGILAYGEVDKVDLNSIQKESILAQGEGAFQFDMTHKIIPHQNWNATWESDFHPVELEDKLTIVAPFHSKEGHKGMLVEIQPQMSFGTGHHQTTWLMARELFKFKSMPAKVLDMGTGTGVLAIIAEKLGAQDLLGIDIEDWTVINAKENIERNNCSRTHVLCGDVDLIEGKSFDLIIANINKNVLKAHIPSYSKTLVTGGTLLLSGFFETDTEELINFSKTYDLELNHIELKEGWAGISLHKV